MQVVRIGGILVVHVCPASRFYHPNSAANPLLEMLGYLIFKGNGVDYEHWRDPEETGMRAHTFLRRLFSLPLSAPTRLPQPGRSFHYFILPWTRLAVSEEALACMLARPWKLLTN